MTDNETVDNFITLFGGRTDAYGSWAGGCIQYDGWQINTPLALHLQQGPFVGVYPLTDDNTVGWGCIDLDGKDFPSTGIDGEPPVDWTKLWATAAEVQDTLAYKGVRSWLERTKNGIHIWVFAAERVQAAVMRNALLVACEVANYKPKEVNPKQCHVSADKPLGNYVRLCYPGALKARSDATHPHGLVDRFVVDEDGQPMTVQDFCVSALHNRTDVRLLEAMSDLYVAPKASQLTAVELDEATEDAFVVLQPILPPVVKLMFEEGPKGDRSSALVRAAVIMRDDHWNAQAAFTVLRALDRLVLRKFADRTDPDKPLLDILERIGL